jgi:hypothetical protein
MFTQSAAWYDRFYDCKDYAREAQRVAALIRQHRPDARTRGGPSWPGEDSNGQCPTSALLGDDPNLRLVPRVQVCVLEPLWSRVTQIGARRPGDGPGQSHRPSPMDDRP